MGAKYISLKFNNRYKIYFSIILSLGIIFRFLSLLTCPIRSDSLSYISTAKSIINFNYETHRPPGFPITIIPFLLLTQNEILSAKLASFSASILLIMYSYFVFTRASLILFKEDKSYKKAQIIGILTSCFIAFNSYFASNAGMGLRENLLALQIILIFYYSTIKNSKKTVDYLILSLLIIFLTLTLLTAGIFMTIGIVFFFLISKIKYFQPIRKISYKKILIPILSYTFAFLFWTLFCAFHFGNPFYNWQKQSSWFKSNTIVDLTSLSKLPIILLWVLITGFVEIFRDLFLLLGVVFMLLVFYILCKNIRKKLQFLFIFIVVGMNFTYLSIFITTPRLIMYFFPLIFYLGAIPLGEILMQLHKSEDKKKGIKLMDFLIILFFISYIFRNFNYYFYFPEESIYLIPFIIIVIITILFLLINEISLFVYLRKNRTIKYSNI